MRKQLITQARAAAVAPLATKIGEAERAINHSMLHLTELLGTIATARLAPDTHFPLDLGLEATEMLGNALTSTISTYRTVVTAHEQFVADRTAAGLDLVAFGDVLDCPAKASAEADVVRLRAVAA